MFARAAIVALLAVSVSGCANERYPSPMALGYHGGETAAAPAKASDARRASFSRRMLDNQHMKQTLGGKVLSAIALERVTGMKPDPRRFRELH